MTYRYLTRVALHYGGDAFNRYIRFGKPVFREDVTGREAFEYFEEGRTFCYVEWDANAFGTCFWRLSVLKAARRDGPSHKIKGVEPGAEILLRVTGKERVQKAYRLIDRIEDLSINPADVPADYYLHAHHMLHAGKPVRPYTRKEHQAFLKARKLEKTGTN